MGARAYGVLSIHWRPDAPPRLCADPSGRLHTSVRMVSKPSRRMRLNTHNAAPSGAAGGHMAGSHGPFPRATRRVRQLIHVYDTRMRTACR
jgi:hypothetical protein